MAILWPFCLGLAKANQIIIKASNLFEIFSTYCLFDKSILFDNKEQVDLENITYLILI